MQPEPLLWIPPHPFLNARVDRLRHTPDICRAIIRLFDHEPLFHSENMMPIRLSMNEHGEDRYIAAPCNRRSAREGVRSLPEEVNDDTITQRRILIADETDNPTCIDHAEHLTYARMIGDVHTYEGTVFVDEAIHPCCALLLCHADDRKPRTGERSAH
jgi:hypothetical protein